MIVKMIFNMPEDRSEWLHAAHGNEYRDVLLSLRERVRSHLKYEVPLTMQELYDTLHEELADTPWMED